MTLHPSVCMVQPLDVTVQPNPACGAAGIVYIVTAVFLFAFLARVAENLADRWSKHDDDNGP